MFTVYAGVRARGRCVPGDRPASWKLTLKSTSHRPHTVSFICNIGKKLLRTMHLHVWRVGGWVVSSPRRFDNFKIIAYVNMLNSGRPPWEKKVPAEASASASSSASASASASSSATRPAATSAAAGQG